MVADGSFAVLVDGSGERGGRDHDPEAAFLAGWEALLDFAGRPGCQRIAAVDGPAVLGGAEWHRIDTEIGLATMRLGLQILDDAGLLAAPFSEALAVLLFGALTEATPTVSRDEPGTPTRRELLAEFAALVLGRRPDDGVALALR